MKKIELKILDMINEVGYLDSCEYEDISELGIMLIADSDSSDEEWNKLFKLNISKELLEKGEYTEFSIFIRRNLLGQYVFEKEYKESPAEKLERELFERLDRPPTNNELIAEYRRKFI